MFQSLVNIWRYAGLLLATLLNMMMSFPLKLAQTYISYCKMAVDGNLIIDANINVFTILIFNTRSNYYLKYSALISFFRCTGVLNGVYGRVQESLIELLREGTSGGEHI